MNDLRHHPEFLIRESFGLLEAEIEDIDEDFIETCMLVILAKDEAEVRQFAAAGIIAGLAYRSEDERLRLVMSVQAVMSTSQSETTHIACVHALRLMPISIEADMALSGILQDEFARPIARSMCASALIRHMQFPLFGIEQIMDRLVHHDDPRVSKLAKIAQDDLFALAG